MRHLLPLLLVAVLAASARARWAMPERVPVERLAANVADYVRRHPDDAHGHYVLGRIHGLALALGSDSVQVYPPRDPTVLPHVDHSFHGRPEGDAPPPEVLRSYLEAALTHLGRALELEPTSALYRLGRAYVLEAGGEVALAPPPGTPALQDEERGETEALLAWIRAVLVAGTAEREAALDRLRRLPAAATSLLGPNTFLEDEDAEVRGAARAALRRAWREAAIADYLAAHEGAIEADLALDRLPLRGLAALVGHEAGQAYLRLVRERGALPGEEDTVERVAEAVARLREKPRGAITPIVFPLDRPRPLASLLDPRRRVRFDLDGDRRAETRSWVRGDTALLVWDPEGTGRVASGRQLLGTATWWLLWRDGYQALDALDDDRDGHLRGAELRGLAAWRDADQDGVSDPGEVEPLSSLGVVALAVRATGTQDGCPSCERGLELADGRVLPTYDWIAR